MEELSEAIRYAEDWVDKAIKITVTNDLYIAGQKATQQHEHSFLNV